MEGRTRALDVPLCCPICGEEDSIVFAYRSYNPGLARLYDCLGCGKLVNETDVTRATRDKILRELERKLPPPARWIRQGRNRVELYVPERVPLTPPPLAAPEILRRHEVSWEAAEMYRTRPNRSNATGFQYVTYWEWRLVSGGDFAVKLPDPRVRV